MHKVGPKNKDTYLYSTPFQIIYLSSKDDKVYHKLVHRTNLLFRCILEMGIVFHCLLTFNL